MVEVTDTPDAPYELCVIGAGIAGLNALFVAQSYLPKGARVALVDRKSAPGGMWTETYDFVRLHQPHPMFTAGNIAWQGSRSRDHLASKSEVLDHFSHCVDVIRQHMAVESFFRHDLVETTDGAQAVTLRVRSLDGDRPDTTLTAHKVIYAVGYDVPCPAPLPLSSSAVRSATPQELDAELLAATTPIYIAGGGKTAMDATLALLAAQPERQVTLLTGPGTIFGNRDRFMPKGLGRWVSGKLFVNVRKDVCERFDGTNEDDVFAYFRDTYAHSPIDGGTRHLFGLMSEAECAAVRNGASLQEGYLADVEDGPDGPALVLRDGTQFAIPPGSVVLNCTGHLLHEVPPPPDVLSPSGRILTISQSATISFLSSVSAYFLTHLFYLGRLGESRVHVLDLPKLTQEGGPRLTQIAIMTQTLLNALHLSREVPFAVIKDCGLDLDRWFPTPRRLLGFLRLKRQAPTLIAHCEAALARVAGRVDATCAPMAEIARHPAKAA